MLFMVISTPRPDHPSQLVASRSAYWDWINPLIEAGQVKSVYARVGRGAVALFDVDSTQTLHRYMNEWSDIIPAHGGVPFAGCGPCQILSGHPKQSSPGAMT